MQPFCRFATQEEAKAAVLHAISLPDWKKRFCTNKKGYEEVLYFDQESTYRIARYAPAGMFSSEEACEEYFKRSVEASADRIARFMMGRGPLHFVTTEFDHVVGQLIQLEEDGSFSSTPCYRTLLALSRNREDKTGLGIYVSHFTLEI